MCLRTHAPLYVLCVICVCVSVCAVRRVIAYTHTTGCIATHIISHGAGNARDNIKKRKEEALAAQLQL